MHWAFKEAKNHRREKLTGVHPRDVSLQSQGPSALRREGSSREMEAEALSARGDEGSALLGEGVVP